MIYCPIVSFPNHPATQMTQGAWQTEHLNPESTCHKQRGKKLQTEHTTIELTLVLFPNAA